MRHDLRRHDEYGQKSNAIRYRYVHSMVLPSQSYPYDYETTSTRVRERVRAILVCVYSHACASFMAAAASKSTLFHRRPRLRGGTKGKAEKIQKVEDVERGKRAAGGECGRMLTFRIIIAKQKFMLAKTRVPTQNYIVFESLKQRRRPLTFGFDCRYFGAKDEHRALIDTLGWNFVGCADINFNENYANYERFSPQLKSQSGALHRIRSSPAILSSGGGLRSPRRF